MPNCFAMAVFERPLSSQCCSNTSVSRLRTDLLPRQKEVKVRRRSAVRQTLTRGLPTVQSNPLLCNQRSALTTLPRIQADERPDTARIAP